MIRGRAEIDVLVFSHQVHQQMETAGQIEVIIFRQKDQLCVILFRENLDFLVKGRRVRGRYRPPQGSPQGAKPFSLRQL